MQEFFEICGNRIPLAEIKEFRIIQCEYIYRPVYRESEKFSIKSLMGKRCEFMGMQPYAAVCNEAERRSAVSEYAAETFKESVAKDLIEGAITTIGDKFNIKAFRSKKYLCRTQAGRTFSVYLEDVPAVLERADGKISDVRKNDELYPLLGEPIAPSIQMIDALMIKAKERYLFYGSGVQLEDTDAEFHRLCGEMDAFRQMQKGSKKLVFPQLPQMAFPFLAQKKQAELPAAPETAGELILQKPEREIVEARKK